MGKLGAHDTFFGVLHSLNMNNIEYGKMQTTYI